jgi:hypothetical protein
MSKSGFPSPYRLVSAVFCIFICRRPPFEDWSSGNLTLMVVVWVSTGPVSSYATDLLVWFMSSLASALASLRWALCGSICSFCILSVTYCWIWSGSIFDRLFWLRFWTALGLCRNFLWRSPLYTKLSRWAFLLLKSEFKILSIFLRLDFLSIFYTIW